MGKHILIYLLKSIQCPNTFPIEKKYIIQRKNVYGGTLKQDYHINFWA